MLAIVMLLVGIALTGLFLYGGTSVLQSNSPIRSQAKESTITSLYALATAYQGYVSANGSDLTTTGSCNNSTNCCLSTELVPTYIKEIKYPVSGLLCGFGNNATNGDYFCYYGSVSQSVYNGFSDASGSFPTGSYVIGTTSCGEHGTTDATPASWPATVYLTYWLQGQ